jgi:exodeoxyribonuclease VII small subunit
MDFEKKLGRLEEIVQKMEKGDASLDESLKLFEEGIRLSRECQEQLGQVEAKIKLLTQIDENGKAVTTDFKPNEN